jgi:dCTP deaminase
MLTAQAIKSNIEQGSIIITPYIEDHVNPNSIDLTLFKELKTYKPLVLDPKVKNETNLLEIPEEGLVLHPNKLYLGRTNEWTESHKHIPLLEGKSSLARLGINIHATAGFGDIGFRGHWVLEITVTHPTFVYPNMKIGQLCFHEPVGDANQTYQGKYQDQKEIEACKSYIKE